MQQKEAANVGFDLGWRLPDLCNERGGNAEVASFKAMAMDAKNLKMYERRNVKCNTVSGA